MEEKLKLTLARHSGLAFSPHGWPKNGLSAIILPVK